MLRLILAFTGTLLYYHLFHPQWNRLWYLLYDIPTLPVVFGFLGAILTRLRSGERRRSLPELIILGIAVGFGAGAQFGNWPLSGHLTVALTVGIQEAADRRNPVWLRALSLIPVVMLLFIRIFCPQTPLMGSLFNTCTALAIGMLLGGIALLCRPFPGGAGVTP
jgi:hypothetical protein